MTEILLLILSLTVSGTCLFFLVWIVSKFVTDKFSKAWHYYIWLLVLLRFLLPITPDVSPVGILFHKVSTWEPLTSHFTTTVDAHNQWINTDVSTDLQNNTSNQQDNPSTQKSFPFTWSTMVPWLILLWLIPALIRLIQKITLYQSFTTYIKAGNNEVSDPAILNTLYGISEDMGIRRQIELYENPLIASPLILGFFKPAIVLPSTKLTQSDFRYIFLHELTHYKRCDIVYKWLAQLILCLHWFNPFMYWLLQEINTACELSCDEAVVKSLDAPEQKAYGDVLIETMSNPGRYRQHLACLTLSENAKILKERLSAIMKYKKKSNKVILCSIAMMAVLGIIGVFIGSSLTNMKTKAKNNTYASIDLNGKSDSYKLIAKMVEVDTSLTLSEYTDKLFALCGGESSFFNALSDAEIQDPKDPLYQFTTGILTRIGSELLSDITNPLEKRNNLFSHATWTRYETSEDIEALKEDMNAEEWNAYLQEIDNIPPSILGAKSVSYHIYYTIPDKDNLTVDLKESMLNSVVTDMQNYVDTLTEEDVYSEAFGAKFAEELKRVTELYSNETMKLEGEIDIVEEDFTPGQNE